YSYDLALQTAYYDTEQTLILNLIFIIFVTALLWISFHRVITAKINQLVGITENIAKGNLSTRTNIVGNNELGRLGNSINEMAAALHENNKQLHFQQRALDSHSIVAITNAQGIITFVNEKFCEISQYSKDELIGSTHKIVNSGLHPKSFFSDLWRTIASGKVWHGEVINKKKNGELYYLETTIVPFLNDQNVPFQYIAIRTDTSKIKETEKQLKQAQKMETMGLLTGGIAHDFNNILASILGYTELSLLKLNIQEVDKVPSYLDQVRHASERARNLIAQMLMFSKIDTERDRTANVFTVTNEVKQLLISTLPANIKINTDISMGLPDISISPTKLLQVLMNLCINARDAIGEHGLIDITANLNNSTDLTCSACHQQFTGEHIIINISDNGDGIDGNLISKIFDPFFTTKGTEKGTGVGLAITRDIVHEADGHIVIKSSNEGTVFQLCFPPLSHEQQSLLQLPENTFDSLNGDNQHILIVDDEAMIAQFEAELLTSHGYQASTDIDSTRVLRMFNSNPDQFDLFIIDQTMPSLNGIDLAKSILERRPDAPIIICTGYSESVNEEIAKQAGVQGFLSKPIDSVTLLKLIRELLTKN
ncbi:MAG: response regulator, partial [Gammaproteobacteria bacterium]|nr:response regulator [Gammaproteobacteria bacterium]